MALRRYNSAMQTLDNVRIVLIETSHPGNIGGAARALHTMGLSQLVLVNPLRYPDPQAEWRAAGGTGLLRNARVVAMFDEAVADCHLVFCASGRERRIPWPAMDAAAAAREIAAVAATQLV